MQSGAAILLVLLLASVPAPAHAQGPVDDARVASVRGRITASIEVADREGLPSEWLVEKVAEGLAKHAPPDRIAAAVDTMLSRLRIAESIRASIRERAPVEARRAALRAIVDALAVGASRTELIELVGTVASTPSEGVDAHERVRLAMRTVAELGERGVNGDLAAQSALRAYRRGGVRGWDGLLDSARGGEAHARGRGRPSDHTIDSVRPPRDDSRGQGHRAHPAHPPHP